MITVDGTQQRGRAAALRWIDGMDSRRIICERIPFSRAIHREIRR